MDCVEMYELSVLLEIPHLGNRILKIIPDVLNLKNFDQGFKNSFESELNDGEKMEQLLFSFQNFYLDHKNEMETSMRKTLNLVKSKSEVVIDEDDFSKEIQSVKMKLWKSREYTDITLVCLDETRIQCHKAVIGVSPLFSKFDLDMSHDNYSVDFQSKPLNLFLELLYCGQVSIKDAPIDVLFDFYHLCNQSDFTEFSQITNS